VYAKLRWATISFVMSVSLSAWNNSAQTGWILKKFDIWEFFKNLWRKFQVLLKSDKNNGTLHEDLCTFVIISRWILLRMRTISDQSCRENQNTYFVFDNFLSENRALYEIMWKKYVWARKATNNTAHAIIMPDNNGYRHTLIIYNSISFARQKSLRESASI
jgi:hypothetical protein